jgi:hypothetical protein
MDCYLYGPDLLPAGFRFPKSFLDFVTQPVLPDLEPWELLCQSGRKAADGWMKALKEQFPTRKLVPFSLRSGSDEVACFDAGKPSGEPGVYYVEAYSPAGMESRGWADNFAAWLRNAERDAAEWKAEEEEWARTQR